MNDKSEKIEVPGYGMLELLDEDTWTGWFELGQGLIQVDVVASQGHPDEGSMRVMAAILPRVRQFVTISIEHLKKKSLHREQLRMRDDLKLSRIFFDTWDDYDFTMYFAWDTSKERSVGVIFKNEEIISA